MIQIDRVDNRHVCYAFDHEHGFPWYKESELVRVTKRWSALKREEKTKDSFRKVMMWEFLGLETK